LDVRLARFLLGFDLGKKNERNAWHMVAEIFWAAFYNATALFNSAYALRLGADNYQVGLLSSLPALLAVVLSIPFGRFLLSCRQRSKWVIGSLTLFRGAYLLIALIPWFPPISNIPYGTLIIVTLVVFSLPLQLFNVGIIPLQAEVIDEKMRLPVFAARSMVYNTVLSLSLIPFGMCLNLLPLPFNYQIIYLFGFLTTFGSLFHFIKLDINEIKTPKIETEIKLSLRHQWVLFKQQISKQPEFLKLTRNTFFLNLGIWAAAPIYILYYVRDLKVSDGWLGLYNAVAAVGLIGGNIIFKRLINRWDKFTTLKRTSTALGIFPILVGFSAISTPIIFITGVGNLVTAGYNLSHINTLLEVIPSEARPTYSAIYNMVIGLGSFAGPLLGVALGELIGFQWTLVICGLVILIGSSLYWLSPVRVSTV
jgi:MFS family permease